MVLISYENEVSPTHFHSCRPNTFPLQAPPQLWRMDLIKDKDEDGSKDARLAYVRSYRPKGKVDFAGPSYFGGTTKDDMVLVPTKSVPLVSHNWSSWAHDSIQECRDSHMGQGNRSTSHPHFNSNQSLTCIP